MGKCRGAKSEITVFAEGIVPVLRDPIVPDGQGFIIVPGKEFAGKEWEPSSLSVDDCNVYGHVRRIWSNGEWQSYCRRLFDAGYFYGDTFNVTVTFHETATGPVLVSYSWSETLGAGETKTDVTKSGYEPGIRELWDRIHYSGWSLECD